MTIKKDKVHVAPLMHNQITYKQQGAKGGTLAKLFRRLSQTSPEKMEKQTGAKMKCFQ